MENRKDKILSKTTTLKIKIILSTAETSVRFDIKKLEIRLYPEFSPRLRTLGNQTCT